MAHQVGVRGGLDTELEAELGGCRAGVDCVAVFAGPGGGGGEVK